jgi:hypothetical protein
MRDRRRDRVVACAAAAANSFGSSAATPDALFDAAT